jgi:hypothetical protein
MNVFDSECDAIIRELSTCMSEDALYDSIDWFSTFNMTASRLDEFKRTLSQKLMALKKIADHR